MRVGSSPPIRPLRQRVEQREYPSVFQAWTSASGLASEAEGLAHHDLIFRGLDALGLKGNDPYPGLASAYTLDPSKTREKAPEAVLLAEFRYRDAKEGYLPPDHRWWKRDAEGQRIAAPGKSGVHGQYYLLDFANPEFQTHLALQARAALATGGVDGLMLDWWSKEDDDRLALLRKLREGVGDGLILVNSFNSRPERSKELVNGLFLEGLGAPAWSHEQKTRAPIADPWKHAQGLLGWAEHELRAPHVNALEAWGEAGDQARLRAVTTLALTSSDGYVLYARPNGTPGQPDHRHEWQHFWDKSLGRPLAPGHPEGPAVRRDFEGGSAVYHPAGADATPARLHFAEPRRSAASGQTGTDFQLPPGDGDLYLISPHA